MSQFIEADHPNRGRLFAAIAPEVRFTVAELRDSRLGATLAPFKSEELALAAIRDAGAKVKETI